MNRPRSRANKEEIIIDLKRIASDLSKSPTWAEFMNLSDIPPSRIVMCYGSFNKALEAAELPINRKGSRIKRAKGYQHTNKPSYRRRSDKYTGYQPVFTIRECNVCERTFQAEDDMRSCPACTISKKSADRRGGLSDTGYGIGYLT